MPPRPPTNTIIATKVPPYLLENPQQLILFLATENNHTIEVVALHRLGRIIIICDTTETAIKVHKSLQDSPDYSQLSLSYSIKDNYFSHADSWQHSTSNNGYLELPQDEASRRFLISPPLSPPTEWDHWDKVEEGPNQKAVYSPEELSHLLWERLGGFDSSTVRKYQDEQAGPDEKPTAEPVDMANKPEILFEDINNGAPAIVLDSIKHAGPSKPTTIAKTAMPPID